jgi:uncharacterized membrane protein YraQ (UPF0718 family)
VISSQAMPNRRVEYIRGFGILLLIAVVGLFIAKWQPYFQRTLTIASTHAYPGSSIVAGKDAAPPVASFDAALTYGKTYFLAIWQALVVGLLLAATLETLVPKDWVIRVLGSSRIRSSLFGGVLALPGMM